MANMSNRMLLVTVGGGSLASIVYMATQVTHIRLGNLLDFSQPGALWKLLAILFGLLNLKSLPLAWHARLIHALFYHTFYTPKRLPPGADAQALFQPVITSSRSPILECDYNLHKSNSTYFMDLDISRMNCVACLMKLGVGRAREEIIAEGKGGFNIMLGGVTCSFQREIKPYEAFEMWSRILTWDRKWLYLVTHVVKKGAVWPTAYTLQPGKGRGKARKSAPKDGPRQAIFATSISKYVFKQGRLTIPPEAALLRSGLLPPRPEGLEPPSVSITPEMESTSIGLDATAKLQNIVSLGATEVLDASLTPQSTGSWGWDEVERERARGMKLAEHMAALDGLQDEFTGDSGPALGTY